MPNFKSGAFNHSATSPCSTDDKRYLLRWLRRSLLAALQLSVYRQSQSFAISSIITFLLCWPNIASNRQDINI